MWNWFNTFIEERLVLLIWNVCNLQMQKLCNIIIFIYIIEHLQTCKGATTLLYAQFSQFVDLMIEALYPQMPLKWKSPSTQWVIWLGASGLTAAIYCGQKTKRS